MGETWHRMRLKDEANHADARKLIEEEAFALRQWDYIFMDDLRPFNKERLETADQRESANQRHSQISEALLQLVDIEDNNGFIADRRSNLTQTSMRAAFITRNDIFPPEWRIGSYRTFLPEEVATHLAQWSEYIRGIRNGGYRNYLLDWYLYREGLNLIEFREDLLRMVQLAHQKAHGWGQGILDTDIPNHIMALPPLTAYTAPKWSERSKTSSGNDYRTDIRYIELRRTMNHLQTLREAWNQLVPFEQHLSEENIPFFTRSFDEYIAAANDSYLEEGFKWLEQCVADEMGLYFCP